VGVNDDVDDGLVRWMSLRAVPFKQKAEDPQERQKEHNQTRHGAPRNFRYVHLRHI